MVDVAETYAQMSEAERARFEDDHFDQLPESDKLRVANQALSSGQIENDSVASYLDKAYGNGDGTFDREDLKLIAAKREDRAFNEALEKTAETMVSAATVSTGLGAWAGVPAQSGFQLGVNGLLGSLFNPTAAGDITPSKSDNDLTQPTGFLQKLSHAAGLDF